MALRKFIILQDRLPGHSLKKLSLMKCLLHVLGMRREPKISCPLRDHDTEGVNKNRNILCVYGKIDESVSIAISESVCSSSIIIMVILPSFTVTRHTYSRSSGFVSQLRAYLAMMRVSPSPTTLKA